MRPSRRVVIVCPPRGTSVGFFVEFGQFLSSHKKLWLASLIVVVVFLALLIFATEHSTIAPFVYTLF